MFWLRSNPLFWREKSRGKNYEKVWKILKKYENYETILPFSCCPLVFPWNLGAPNQIFWIPVAPQSFSDWLKLSPPRGHPLKHSWGSHKPLNHYILNQDILACAPLQKIVGDLCGMNLPRILPGIFLEDFSGHFSPTKMRRKIWRAKSAKKSGGSKIKIRERSVLPNTDNGIFQCTVPSRRRFPCLDGAFSVELP